MEEIITTELRLVRYNNQSVTEVKTISCELNINNIWYISIKYSQRGLIYPWYIFLIGSELQMTQKNTKLQLNLRFIFRNTYTIYLVDMSSLKSVVVFYSSHLHLFIINLSLIVKNDKDVMSFPYVFASKHRIRYLISEVKSNGCYSFRITLLNIVHMKEYLVKYLVLF